MADKGKSKEPTTSLATFERLVFGGGYEQAMEMLLFILNAFERGADVPTVDGKPANAAAARRYCTRLASAITALFAMGRVTIPPSFNDRLAYHNRHLAAIFRLSGFANPGYLCELLHAVRPGDGARVLSVYSVDCSAEINWRELLRKHAPVAASAYMAQFSYRAPLSSDADRRREALLELAPLLDGLALRDSQFPILCQAWMFCSYLMPPRRHELKHTLNGLVSDWLARAGIRDLPLAKPRLIEDRPTLAVVADVLISWHAMFKTYGNFLKQLGTRFRLVLVILEARADDVVRELFDDVVEVADKSTALAEIRARIEEIGPAIIYYPSVGMSVITIQLCNLRLAPIQIASVGHPATTHSRAIDYMIMGHTYYSDDAYYSERVLLLRSTGALFEPTMGAKPIAPRLREAPDTLRIAVSSSALKINATFLSLCRAVESEAGRRVEFHFFPNELGLRRHDCELRIQEFLPDAIVHPRVDYDDYLALLNACDIRFGTFPFGGANTTMDAFLLGIPTVTFQGAEPHNRTDARFITLFELPDWLIARDLDAYRAAAVRLIRDDDERVNLARRIVDANPSKMLFEKEQDSYPMDFADTVWWIYEHHEKVQSSGRRVWRWDDRVELAGKSI
jgi:hypothetical protein